MRTVAFFVGAPGAGKTTLVREILGERLKQTSGASLEYIEKPKWTLVPGICAAGHYKGEVFDGADRVPYNGVAEALTYWQNHLSDRQLTIFDGDRFSYMKVVDHFANVAVKCVMLRASNALLDERRAQRGSNQNETWMKGRITKAEKFFAAFAGDLSISLDASKSVKALRKQLVPFLGL